MNKTIKVRLEPNNIQKTMMKKSLGISRFAYNWALNKQQENYKENGKFLNNYDMRKEFTIFKSLEENNWLYEVSCDIPKQAIKDAERAFINFFKKKSFYPKFKSKKNNMQSFFQDTFKFKVNESKVYLSNIGWIKLSEKNKIPIGHGKDLHFKNIRITYDKENWYISVGIECENQAFKKFTYGIGIDLGIKDLAICSDGHIYKNINKQSHVKKIEKKKHRLQRILSRKYEMNKKGDSYCKTSNIIKLEKSLLKINHHLRNIRKDYINKITTEIIKRKPSFITIEELNISGMMKNKHLSKQIANQCLYEFIKQLKYKASWYGIELRQVDRFYPSSKICHNCGTIKHDLKLKDRIYKCDCGYIEDRDYNASLNLKDCKTYKVLAL